MQNGKWREISDLVIRKFLMESEFLFLRLFDIHSRFTNQNSQFSISHFALVPFFHEQRTRVSNCLHSRLVMFMPDVRTFPPGEHMQLPIQSKHFRIAAGILAL